MAVATTLLDTTRGLIVAGATLLVCLIAVLLPSSSAHAHAGHRHVTPTPAAIVSAAQPMMEPVSAAAVGHAISTEASQTLDRGAVSAASPDTLQVVPTAAVKAIGVGACGACASCSSMSCCSAVLVATCDNRFVRSEAGSVLPSLAARMASAGIAPLQRPPNSHLLT